MPRAKRIVVPNFPHHVTQRGNRRQPVFFCDEDYQAYLDYVKCAAKQAKVEILAYCLMPNHVHFVAVPTCQEGLRHTFGDAHQRYTRRINFREGWRGYLWQGRFFSNVMDERHLVATVRYIELNPVEASLCALATDWPWSSVHAHLAGEDEFVAVKPMLSRVKDWRSYLVDEQNAKTNQAISQHVCSGRPLGDDSFLDEIGQIMGVEVRGNKKANKPDKGECVCLE